MKLPYTKTTIRDMSQYTNIGDGSSGVNIAAVINAKTGPMERVTLTSFDDLVNNFCTGSAITQKDDTTVQNIGALLNSAAVDVIRVGTAKLRVGKTDDNKLIYTDNDYNFIDTLSRVSIKDNSEKEKSLVISDDEFYYYVGDTPKGTISTIAFEESNIEDYSVDRLVRYIVEKVDSKKDEKNKCYPLSYHGDTFYFENAHNFYDTYLANTNVTFINATSKISVDGVEVDTMSDSSCVIINNTTYLYNQSKTDAYDEPIVNIIPSSSYGGYTKRKFLASIIANMPNEDVVGYRVNFDFSNVSDCSDNIKARMYTLNEVPYYSYSRDEKLEQFYMVLDHEIYQLNNCPIPEKYIQNLLTDDETSTIDLSNDIDGEDKYHLNSIVTEETDFIKIWDQFNASTDANMKASDDISVSDAVVYVNDANIYNDENELFDIDRTVDGIYKCTVTPVEYQIQDYSIFIDGYTYYCGTEPTGKYTTLENDEEVDATIEYVQLSQDRLPFDEFLEKLTEQLIADRTVGCVNVSTFLFIGDVTVKRSDNLITVKTNINQSENIAKSKFALVAKFPTTQKLFSYSFVRNDRIENYDIIDINWTYNQVSGSMSIGFDENAVDDYGNLMYYTKYNEGDYENNYFHIMHFNDFVKWDNDDTTAKDDTVYISEFGNEIIMSEPNATDYANAIAKFSDYEDKQYSFIWDAGYASPILAKAMNKLAIEKNAQFVPSFPSTVKTVDAARSYHQSLGLNTYEAVEVLPSFKGTFCGSFLTTVPGGLAYIMARVNSYNNTTTEFQPLFGPTRGAVSAPNLMWNINKNDQQSLADMNINSIVSNINGTYINFNLTSQKATSYLSEEQNVYMSNTIAHVCEEYNPKIIAEQNTSDLWNNVVNQLTQLLENRMMSGKYPTYNAIRVICNDKLNTQDVIEARQLKYKVQVMYNLSVSYVDAYVDVVRLNSF